MSTDEPTTATSTTTARRTPRTAVVTGGSRGLGRATALALADAGLDVVVTYRSGEAEARQVVAALEAKGRRGWALHLDTTDVDSFGDFASRLRDVLPDSHFDVLVNNAGTALYSPLRETTQEQFDTVFAVHVKGPFFLTQTLEPLLNDGGRIVNVSSALTRMAFARSGPYASAKGAVEVLTRYQALEYGERGVTANVVAVGSVPTDFGGGHLRNSPELQQQMIESAALKRLATPEDVGLAIAGLTTASGTWITGQRIEASGGVRL
jgi:NAD(P)-dependent dehydrogenase (short-subunit alcohol dehydrogenase family)